MAKLGSGGRVRVFNSSGSTDVILDVGGWFTDASVGGVTGAYVPLDPVRTVDTRLGLGVQGPVGGGTTTEVQVTGRGGIPAAAVSAVETRPNLVVVAVGANGRVSLFTSAATNFIFDVAGWYS